MTTIKTFGPAVLLAVALLAAPPQASAAQVGHRHLHRHRHAVQVPDNAPPTMFTPETRLPGREAAPTFVINSPDNAVALAGRDIADPLQVEVPTAAPNNIADGPQPFALPTTRQPVVPYPIPGPPKPQNTRAVNIEGASETFEKFADRTQPSVWRTGRPALVTPSPNPPNARPVEVELATETFGKFADRTSLLVRSSGGGGGISPQPHSANRQLVSDNAIWFFLSAVGFFFPSLIWNLHLQVGLARDQAKKTDANAVAGTRLENLANAIKDGGKPSGQGGWLQAGNEAPAPVLVV